MNRNLLLALTLALTLAACRGSDAREPRSTENFEVINEGSASGVTSTLGGESVNSMTSTAADTTTEFTILQEPTLTDTTGTTLADHLPSTTAPATSVAPRSGVGPARVPSNRPTIEITRGTPPPTSTQPPAAAPRPAPPAPEARPAPAPAPPETETAPSDDEQDAPADDDEETEDAPPPPTTT